MSHVCRKGTKNIPYRQAIRILFYHGVKNSQHLTGQAADIRPQDPKQFRRLVEFLKTCEYTDQLLTGNGWLHISWNPFSTPRHYVRIGYY